MIGTLVFTALGATLGWLSCLLLSSKSFDAIKLIWLGIIGSIAAGTLNAYVTGLPEYDIFPILSAIFGSVFVIAGEERWGK